MEKQKRKKSDEGHYEYKIGEVMKHYRIEKHISDGTFGRCFLVTDLEKGTEYAMKVIRAVERYVWAAKEEVAILKELQSKDTNDYIVKLVESFSWGLNYCLVFEKLGQSLYQVLNHSPLPLPLHTVQHYTKQILLQL